MNSNLHNSCYFFSISDIIFDFILFATYLGLVPFIKTVKDDTIVQNVTGRRCTFVEENDEGYNFSCDEYNPMFASLTLLFIYMPSLNVLATLLGPKTAGAVGIVWGIVMWIVGTVTLNIFMESVTEAEVMGWFLRLMCGAML